MNVAPRPEQLNLACLMNLKVGTTFQDHCPTCNMAIKGKIISISEAKVQCLYHGTFNIPLGGKKRKRFSYNEIKKIMERNPGISLTY